MKASVRTSIYHHATRAWLAWQEAEEAGDSGGPKKRSVFTTSALT